MRKILPSFALLGLTACHSQAASEREFFVADAPGENASFLVERHSGCVWALVVERDGAPSTSKDSMSVEEFERFVRESDQYLGDAKKYGRFQLVDVKSAKTEACRKTFGMTGEPVKERK